MSHVRAIALLLLLLALAVTQTGKAWIDIALVPFIATLAAAELDRGSGAIATVVVTAAARLLPARDRVELRDEWVDHVLTAGDRGVLPLTRALSIAAIAVPMLAVGLRIGRRRHASAG